MTKEIDMLLTDVEVAKRLGISRPTLWRHIKNGLVPKPVKLGRSTRWPESEINAFMEILKNDREGV